MRAKHRKTGVRLRVVLKPGVAFGPGKADLLDGIARTGSIAAAGRQLGMSYKRAWSLVEVMNREFRAPLVTTNKGGRAFGGAELTDTGRQVLDLFRTLEARARASTESQAQDLRALLNDVPD